MVNVSTMLLIESDSREEVDLKVAELTAGEWEVWTGTDLNRDRRYEAVLILPEIDRSKG